MLFPLILAQYYAFLLPLLWAGLDVIVSLTTLYTCFAIGTIVSVYFTVGTDPIDDSCSNSNDGHRIEQNEAGSSSSIHCYLCEKDVHASSKHCRECDKCVLRFDHHCKWLNTCIGAKNYLYFLSIIVTVTLLTLESLSISIALLVEAFAFSELLMHRVNRHHHLVHLIGSQLSIGAIIGLLIASILVLLAVVVMLLQLGSFHIVLLYRGLTTYDFIVMEQKRLRDKEQERIRMKQQQLQSKPAMEGVPRSEGRGAEIQVTERQVTPSSMSEQRVVRDYDVSTADV